MTRAAAGAALGAGLLLALLAPDLAAAHGVGGREDLPIPKQAFIGAAAAVLALSFVALAALWPKARFEQPRGRDVLRVPRVVEVLCGAIGVALFGVVVYAGLAGTQSPAANIAPTFVYVLFWVGVPVLSLFFGDAFRAFNPWRAVARAAGWLAGRVAGGDALPAPLPYPERLGRWPAAATILAFAWVELAWLSQRDDPSTLAILALAYAAVQLVGMALYGVEPWTRRADGFSVYFALFATLAPLRWHDRRLEVRRPLAGAAAIDPVPGTVALLAVMIGSTSFDGFKESKPWGNVAPDLQSVFADLGFSSARTLEGALTVGLLVAVLAIGGLYLLAVRGMTTVQSDQDTRGLSRRFAHSLVPIALAYVVAHYFSLLAYQGQAAAYLASDPLGEGADLFGTASTQIDYSVVSANGVWYVQVGALVIGHVAGLVLAHDRALGVFRDARTATSSQWWMLAVMIAFTTLGLYLLSAVAE